MLKTPLFTGSLVRLTPIDSDRDAEIESGWTHDAEYLSMLGTDLVRPLSVSQVKKKYTAIEKEAEEKKNLFYFAIRLCSSEAESADRTAQDERLVGFIRLYSVEWSNGHGMLQMGIGDPRDRNHGYGYESLRLLVNYAFTELNLFRLEAAIPEYNQVARHVFEKAGFCLEARLRQAINHHGQRWDLLYLGIIQE